MRTGIDKTIDAMVRQGVATEDIVDFITNNLTTQEANEMFVASLLENQRLKEEKPAVIRITQSDFNRHFRIIGRKTDGTQETRGRFKCKE